MSVNKYVVVQKIENVVVVIGSRELQKAELQNIQLVVVMYSVGLTLRHRPRRG